MHINHEHPQQMKPGETENWH